MLSFVISFERNLYILRFQVKNGSQWPISDILFLFALVDGAMPDEGSVIE
jgi:hypothetical protein